MFTLLKVQSVLQQLKVKQDLNFKETDSVNIVRNESDEFDVMLSST